RVFRRLQVSRLQRENQRGGKRISGADAVDDLPNLIRTVRLVLIQGGKCRLPRRSVIKQRAPVVVTRGQTLPKRNCHATDPGELFNNLSGDLRIPVEVKRAVVYIAAASAYP